MTLPWIAAAARHAPVPPPELSDALLGVITLAFSLTNTFTVFTVAKAGLAARLPPAASPASPARRIPIRRSTSRAWSKC